MRNYSTGEMLFRLVCLVVLSSVESFNWTAQPINPTPAIKGQDVSLAWNYSLTADELLQSQTQFIILWKKLNQLTLNYDLIGTKSYFQFIGVISYNELQAPRIVIDKSDRATLHINDVRREDEGTYKIEFTLKTDGSVLAEQRMNLTVSERPELDYASDDQDVCEDSMVTLYCNATGKPAPNINWTRVWENGTDSEQLPVVDDSYVMSNIKRSSNGIYRCTAYNGVGDPVNRTVKVIVRYSASVVRVVKSSNTVTEGDTFSLTCEVSGDPRPNVTWITVKNDEYSYGNILNFTNIMRGDSGDYKCETKNRCGEESRNESIDVFFPPAIDSAPSAYQVIEDNGAILFCNATGNPQPNITWTKQGNNSKLSTSETLYLTKLMREDDGSEYKCRVTNEVGSTEAIATVTVFFAPRITNISGNTTVNESDSMTLVCTADGNPTPTITWTRVSDNRPVSFPLTITSKQHEGGYRCTANNDVKTPDSNVTFITVQYFRPINTVLNSTDPNIVKLNVTFNITCSAEANPPAKYSFYDGGKIITSRIVSGNTYTALVRNRIKKVTYGCLPHNEFGNGSFKEVEVSVHYAPDRATLTTVPSNRKLLRGSIMSLNCRADASPEAEYHFYFNDNPIGNSSSGVFNTTVMADGVYTCVPNNTVGKGDNATVDVTAVVPESNYILVTLTVTNKGCDDNPSEICEQLGEKVDGQIKRNEELKEPKSVTVENCVCGSVTAYLSLDFTENVKIPDVISVLKEAAENNGFGGLDVNPGSIQAISEEQLPSDSPSTTVGTTTSEGDKDNGMLWIIIGASLGGAIVLIIVVAVVAWCVHHKRKCRRKGSKVRCSESEAFAPEEGNDHGHANNGYADAGPRPTAVEDMSKHQGASAVPTYSVVDKSAKKASKKDKKVEEKKPQAAPPEYAAVDKSKKKKKEEPEATYAEVEKSKKSKKKPKPGEVLYADLGDFHQMQELPAVSTSPQALPPIKKPTPYNETQYADITQFLKGDATLPESNNSKGPGTGTQAAPAPENSNSQKPGANTKETSQASNPGGDGGPGHETNF